MLWKIILLGIVQGLTEWLPVSSSGHLVIFQEFFNINVSLLFDVVVHIASLVVLLIVFKNDIIEILKSFKKDGNKNYRKLGYFILIGSVFTAIIASLLREYIEIAFSNTLLVGIALLITGFMLLFTKNFNGHKKVGFLDSVLIGVMQGLAVFPGISRSGSTIALGLYRKIERKEAARFSFLLFIPAVIGSLILQLNMANNKESFFILFVGFIVSLVVSYIALKWFLRIIERGNMYKFAYYCFVLSIIVILFSVLY